ncbi:MAG: phosphate ABC transporter substrate-binding protein PstS [Thaumarchaeota archaeon]|nr:phosphate ABC transporter substrate-binding protein PstS [Nitrososphaerota archaeon]
MKFSRTGISTTAIAAIAVVAIIVVGAGAYLAASGSKTTTTVTTTALSTTTSVSTSLTTSTAVVNPTVSVKLTGAGSTFINPVLQAMISAYQAATPTVAINYQSVGSGAGISALEGHTVDFAASDAPLQAADIAKAPNALTIPTTIGAEAIAYNVPGIASNLHLTGKVIADIFSGNVTTWNNPEIQSLNTNVTLPSNSILVVHRSDSSGTTFVFTGYLSQESAGWNKTYGQSKTIGWPVGLGANGNAGVAGVVQGTTYTIGYVELDYAIANKMTVASVENNAGNWVLPTLASSAAAATSVTSLPAGNGVWSTFNLLNQPGANTYPIVTFSYILVYKDLSVNTDLNVNSADALVNFLYWAVNTGQGQAQGLSYVPLPANVVAIDVATIQSITFGTTALAIQQ